MPVIKITTNFSLGNTKQQLVDQFHELMLETFKITEHDRLMIIDEKPDDFFQPTNTNGNYTLVEIQLFHGRSMDVKRQLYDRIVKLLENYHVPSENTRIVLHEIDRGNWGIRGGKAASDVDLGYAIDV